MMYWPEDLPCGQKNKDIKGLIATDEIRVVNACRLGRYSPIEAEIDQKRYSGHNLNRLVSRW